MVIKSLKTRIFSGLLACLFLMPVVSTIHADSVNTVAEQVPAALERAPGIVSKVPSILFMGGKFFHNLGIFALRASYPIGKGFKAAVYAAYMASEELKKPEHKDIALVIGVGVIGLATYAAYKLYKKLSK